jgi:hypothetical protein
VSQHWTTNSAATLAAYIANVHSLFDEHKYLTWPAPRIGPDRSLGQNALFYSWITYWAADIQSISEKEAAKDEGLIEGMKIDLKTMYYLHTGYPWLVCDVRGSLSKREKIGYTSSAKWGRGEMFEFLTWMQLAAASTGVVLESRGQFNKLQRDQNNT